MSESIIPEEPMLRPIDGGGGDDPLPPPTPQVTISQVSPIAAGLAGGVEITITGSSFQPGAQVFFGSSAAPSVTFISSTTVRAVLPPSTQTGSVNVSLVNPNSSNATRAGGFTYVTPNTSGRAEVIGVEPLAVIEDLQTDVTLRGRNLIAAHNAGCLILRGPARATLTLTNFRSTTDQATGIEEVTLNVRVTASPPLAAHERLVVQILASRRSQAVNVGVFESSRQMFTVLPRNVPVLLGYTATLDPSRPNMVVVAGKNLCGCSLNLGPNATIHIQKSDDDVVAGIVTLSPNQPPPELSVRSKVGAEIARFEMAVLESPNNQVMAAAAADGEISAPLIDVSLTAAPDQQIVAPAEQDSRISRTNSTTSSNLIFNWSNFDITAFEVFLRFRIINIVRLIPFFDGGGDELESPIAPQVGKLFRVRGAGLLFALRVEITVTITVVVIIGFRFDVWDFGLFNEFPEFSWGLGSIVIGFRVHVHVSITLHSLTALVLPNGRLQVLSVIDLTIGIDFTITNNDLHLNFDPRFSHKVIFRDIKPIHPLFLCDGRFQLAEENGQTVFPDGRGGSQSFYFVRSPGTCCLTWQFNLDLVRFTAGGPETIAQGPFNADLCVTAQPAPGLANIIITSENPEPTGVPPRLTMTFSDRATLKCLAQPVDANGNPTGTPQDVTTLGYSREFFLDPFGPDVLDPTLVGPGDAAPVLAGENLIRVRVWPRGAEPQFFTFWPGAILGFAIRDQLSRGLPPAVIGSNPLPVTVQNPTQIVVTPTVVFTDPQNPNTPTESPALFTHQQEQVREIERSEPFEPQQLEYRLAVKLSFPSKFSFPANLKFKITSVQMMVLERRGTATTVATPAVFKPPLEGTELPGRVADDTSSHFFNNLVQVDQEITLSVPSRPPGNKLHELSTFKIAPNIKDDLAQQKLVPPGKLVADREVMLLINLQESSGAPAAAIKQLKLVVRNDETYEEYLRVFPQIRTILSGTPFEQFPANFMSGLPQEGPPAASLLEAKGKELWNLAVSRMQTVKDDRPLYWTRLLCIGALRAYFKRRRLAQPTVSQFEWPSRGLEQVDGRIGFVGVTGRRAIVTGYDPFQLPAMIDRSNLSGMVALSLHNKPIATVHGSTLIRTAVFPVRYQDFDENIAENAVGPNLSSIALLMTTSQGGPFYDVDRFAGKNRGATLADNNQKRMLALTDPGGATTGGPQFIESTLPYERVITDNLTTRTGSPFSAANAFILNQAYAIVNGPRHFQPTNPNLDETYKKIPDVVEGTALEGSGGDFLSNEIFYRTALLRLRNRPALPSGHLHVPTVGNQPQTLGPAFINAIETALTRFLNDTLRLRSLGRLSFPDTAINRTSAPFALRSMNETNAAVSVHTVEIDPPQGFARVTPLPAQAGANSVFSLLLTFSPTEVRDYASIVRVRDAGGQILFSELVTGTGIPLPPAPQIALLDPASGQIGDSFTISGANLDGATAVRIGTLATSFFVVSPTEIIADVSGPPRIGVVSVDTPSGTATSPGTFRVIRPPREPIILT